MYWFIGVAIIIFLLVRVISLTDQMRMHERWIKKLNKEIKALKTDLDKVKEDTDKEESGVSLVESVEKTLEEGTGADSSRSIRIPSEIEPDSEQVEGIDKAEYESESLASEVEAGGQSGLYSQDNELYKEVIKTRPHAHKKRVKIKPSVRKNKASQDKSSFDLSSLSIESIISKMGIGLVLVGLGFLFNYAYDRGLITEQLTIIMGYLLGMGLYGSGFFTIKKGRETLGYVLIGGSVSAFYITTYAGFLYYDLIGQPLAFAVLCAITLWAFLSSVYLKAQSISIVAVVGGLLVPFMTDLDFIGLSGLGIYIGIVALGTMIIYFFHRWCYLQVAGIVSVYGALFLMGTGYNMVGPDAVLFFGLLVYLVIVHTLPDIVSHYLERLEGAQNTRVNLINVVAPLVTVVYAVYFDLASQSLMALVFAGLAILYAGVFTAFIRKQGL